MLGHKVSERGVEVDKAKIEVIEKLPPPRGGQSKERANSATHRHRMADVHRL